MEQGNNESKKNDRLDDKLRWELLPLEDIEDIVKVYTAGAKKYGPNTWQNLPDGYNRYKAAFFRHLLEHEKGNWYQHERKAYSCAAYSCAIQFIVNLVSILSEHLSSVSQTAAQHPYYLKHREHQHRHGDSHRTLAVFIF